MNANKGTQASPPAPGDGAHPKIAESGWDVSFNDKLEPDSAALRNKLQCNPGYPAWSDQPGGTDTRPMNCVNWFEAFAFCAWDGGRLPTKMELTYAAAGGSEGRDYPWGAGIDTTRASYECAADGSDAGACAFSDLLAVGSTPLGDGRWGHADLAGNVWEWALDWLAAGPSNCVDCAVLKPDAVNRVRHGGSFVDLAPTLLFSVQDGAPPLERRSYFGLRCARAVP